MLCLHVCTCQTFFLFFSQDIIILTAQCKEANNYVTQKAISSPRLGHLLVLPLLPPPRPPCVLFFCPFATYSECFLDRVENCPVHRLSSYLFPVIPLRSKECTDHYTCCSRLPEGSLSLLGGGGCGEGRYRRERESERKREQK